MSDRPNLERSLNPCCGYLTDASDEIIDDEIKELEKPRPGDVALCLNCGAVLVYKDGPRNITRLCGNRELARVTKKDRRILAKLQRYVRARGLIHPRWTG
jgi:hypothetical protein